MKSMKKSTSLALQSCPAFWRHFMLWVLLCFTNLAQAQYRPPVSTELSIMDIHVAKNWSVRQRMEVINKVETDQGIALLGEQKITYNSAHERVRVIKAYTLQPDGSKDAVTPDRIRTQDDQDDAGNGIYSESKVKVIIFPNVKVGSRTYYLVESLQHTPDFPGHYAWTEYFSPHRKYGRAEVRFSHAPSLDIRVEGRGMTGGRIDRPQSAKNDSIRYLYSISQSTAHPTEPLMVSYADFAPQFSASSFKSYAEVAKAYQDRARPKAEVTQSIKEQAIRIVGDASTTEEKVRRLYNWVARNIRYLGIYAGAGGYVPHSAEKILRARYGDCKDHATLLEALLRAVGIESSTALINSDRAYRLPDPPSFGVFDHVITYVPELNLFLDSTSRMTPMGLLPDGDVGKLTVIAATGQVLSTPLDDPSKDKTVTRTSMNLRADGSVQGSTKVEQFGYFELLSRAKIYGNQNKPADEIVGNMLSRFNMSGTGTIVNPDPLNMEAQWVVTADFLLEPIVNLPGMVAMTMPVGLAQGRFQTLASTKAQNNARFPFLCGSSSHEEQIALAIPPEMKLHRLPTNVQLQTKTLSYQATYEADGNTIKVSRKFMAQRGKSVCEKADETEWEQFTKVLQRDLRQQFFLE
jgi:transglutaminase-like putative cysteine protease